MSRISFFSKDTASDATLVDCVSVQAYTEDMAKKHLTSARKHKSGQAMTEYILMVTTCVMVVVGVMSYMLVFFGNYYTTLIRFISLPFP